MTEIIELKQGMTLSDIYIKDWKAYPYAGVTKYEVSYTDYTYNIDNKTYSYSTSDAIDIVSIQDGAYIPISEFISDDESFNSIIQDGAYSFTVTVSYFEIGVELEDVYNIVSCFYQDIYNVYSQVHLNYDWTNRYKEDPYELASISEELT